MDKDQKISSDLLRGSIDTIILGVLVQTDNYGYNIIKEIFKKSEGGFELKEPTLYSSLRRLESQQLIESYWGEEATQGGRRKYYRVNESGYDAYYNNLMDWENAKKLIDQLLMIKIKEEQCE
ncbi:PadR family transcriptional regulator [Paenibacillus xylanexedens]|uniref:PadR family transcriptional regulator n=1 Tax=Paenibacillus xylanexedens TaxID=528191 RepID=UPI003D07650F